MTTCAGVLGVRRRDLHDRLLPEREPLGQRAPRLGDDPQPLVLAPQWRLLEVGVQLDLVDCRRLAGCVDDRPQVRLLEVRHPDRANQPFALQLDERLPRVHVAVVRGHRPVDQVQVEIVEPQAPHAGVERPFGLLVAVVLVEALARHEYLLAPQPRAANRLTDGRLVAVRGRRVDVAVPHRQRTCHDGGRFSRRNLKDAEAQLRDDRIPVQGDARDALRRVDLPGAHAFLLPRGGEPETLRCSFTSMLTVSHPLTC
jgi:hypothetical protein